MIRKKYANKPKTHGSGNMYIDAAVEALQQAHKEDDRVCSLLVFNDEINSAVGLEGELPKIASSLTTLARKDKDIAKMLIMAYHGYMFKMDSNKPLTKEQQDIIFRDLRGVIDERLNQEN